MMFNISSSVSMYSVQYTIQYHPYIHKVMRLMAAYGGRENISDICQPSSGRLIVPSPQLELHWLHEDQSPQPHPRAPDFISGHRCLVVKLYPFCIRKVKQVRQPLCHSHSIHLNSSDMIHRKYRPSHRLDRGLGLHPAPYLMAKGAQFVDIAMWCNGVQRTSPTSSTLPTLPTS